MKIYRLTALLMSLTLLAGGCARSVPLRDAPGVTLPPVSSPYQPPVGDGGEDIPRRVVLCLPDAVSGQLSLLSERLPLPSARHPAEAVLTRLFSYPSSGQARALSPSGTLSLMPGRGVEISGGTAVVNLSAGALGLTGRDLFMTGSAITHTLSQWGDIRYVNILINDQQPGLDAAAALPLGSLAADAAPGSAESQWEARSSARGGFTLAATLYFPAAAGRGVLAEGRPVNFPDTSLVSMVLALLRALSAGASALPGVPQVPDLTALLSGDPLVDELPGAQGRVVQLTFQESANEQLIAAGIPRSIMMASLCLTLTTFLPGVAGIRVRIGSEMISAVVPAGIFEGAGQEIVFSDQVMRRSDFSHFLLDYCTLYFGSGSAALSPSARAIPYYQARSPRYVLGQLLHGPEYTDSVPGLLPVLPGGMKDADWLGISRQNDTLLVNISAAAGALFKPLDEAQERLMVYGMVNTLSRLGGVSKVAFFIDGKQEGTFARYIDLSGVFLPSAGLVAP